MYALPVLTLKNEIRDCLNDLFVNGKNLTEDDPVNRETQLQSLLQTLGTPPSFTTLRINTGKISAEIALSLVSKELEKQYRKRNWSNPEVALHPHLHDVIIVKNRGPNMELTQADKEVIVDQACGMAVLRGADVFVQGIMGAPLSTKSQDKVSVFVDIDGKCRRGLCQPFDENKVYIGNGIIQYSRAALYCTTDKLSGVGISMTEPLYEAPCLSDFLPEYVFSQNLPSIVCSHVLNPQPGETVLDMCAAPGGKTTHIATLMKNQGRVVAIDKTPQKVERIQCNLKAWNIDCVETYCFDSTNLCSHNSDEGGCPPYPPNSFDRVLLDGPCSALGQRPSCVNKMGVKTLKSYPILQKKLMRQAVELVKHGGCVVYSTCTITSDENENMVEWALKTFPSLELVSQEPNIGKPGLVASNLSADLLDRVQRFGPSCVTHSEIELNFNTDTIGFFVAKFVKR